MASPKAVAWGIPHSARDNIVVVMSNFRAANCLRLFLLATLATGGVLAQTLVIPPTPGTLVNDFAELLAPGERETLERKLVAYDDSTSTQITVVIFQTLNGADPGGTATAIGRVWGVGQEGTDNGVVLLVSVEDRELFIATGYGIEAVLTDAQAGRIIRNVIAPRFREGRYYEGIDEATSAIISAAEGEFAIEDGLPDGVSAFLIVMVFVILFLVVIVAIILTARKGAGGSGWVITSGGSGWSGGGGGGFSGGGGFGGFGGGGFGGGGAGGGW